MENKQIKKGDICVYHFAEGNGSLNIVKVTEVINEDTSNIKCLQVIIDNSGNGWFEFMLRTDTEMLASNEYLYPIDLIRQCKSMVGAEDLQEYVQKEVAIAIKDFANELKRTTMLPTHSEIDNVVKRRLGGKK